MPRIAAFRRGVPTARIVVLPNANHYVFKSNEAEVLRDVRAFIDRLSPPKPDSQSECASLTQFLRG